MLENGFSRNSISPSGYHSVCTLTHLVNPFSLNNEIWQLNLWLTPSFCLHNVFVKFPKLLNERFSVEEEFFPLTIPIAAFIFRAERVQRMGNGRLPSINSIVFCAQTIWLHSMPDSLAYARYFQQHSIEIVGIEHFKFKKSEIKSIVSIPQWCFGGHPQNGNFFAFRFAGKWAKSNPINLIQFCTNICFIFFLSFSPPLLFSFSVLSSFRFVVWNKKQVASAMVTLRYILSGASCS